MKVLIYPFNHDILDGAIKAITHGYGSHVAMLRKDEKTIHEAFWPRVHDRAYSVEDRKNAEVYELEGMFPKYHDAFEHLFDANIKQGIEYSIMDLFRFALNIPSKDESHTFCSRYFLRCCYIVLPYNLMPLVRIPNNDWGSPRDCRISPRLHLISSAQK